MLRDTASLTAETFDLLVVGGGVHGVCAARDAAARGLRVALIERADFGGATSHNSLKILHGGLRYLQHADLRRVRDSVRAQRFWLRQAPHLTRPLGFVIPARGYGARGPLALRAGLAAYRLLSADRNSGLVPERRLPAGRMLSREACTALYPAPLRRAPSGGALWYEGQMVEADRVLIETVLAAQEAGTAAVNHVEALALLRRRSGAVCGVRARDCLGGETLELRARFVLNAAGPWAEFLSVEWLGPGAGEPRFGLTRSMNLVVRLPPSKHALGVYSERPADGLIGGAERLYFLTPWHDYSIIGTTHFDYRGHPDDCRHTDADVEDFLGEINAALPGLGLSPGDVVYRYGGLTPGEHTGRSGGETAAAEARRAHHGAVLEYAGSEGEPLQGYATLVGVKYTTAPLAAAAAVDRVCERLAADAGRADPSSLPVLPGARGLQRLDQVFEALGERAGAAGEASRRFGLRYGARAAEVLERGGWDAADGGEAWFRCACREAVRNEMAVRLDDVLLRRVGLLDEPDKLDERIEWALRMTARALGWDEERARTERETLAAALPWPRLSPLAASAAAR